MPKRTRKYRPGQSFSGAEVRVLETLCRRATQDGSSIVRNLAFAIVYRKILAMRDRLQAFEDAETLRGTDVGLAEMELVRAAGLFGGDAE